MLVAFGGEQYRITTTFGEIDSWHKIPHSGLDLAMKCGTPVKAPTDGIIEQVVDYGSQNIGRGVIMKVDDGNHLIFGHLSENGGVHVGQHVNAGDVIGISGTTGRSSGCHLHLGAKDPTGQHFIDPGKYLDGTKHFVHHVAQTSDNIADMLSQQFSQFSDQIASWSLEFINFSLQFDWITPLLKCACILFGL